MKLKDFLINEYLTKEEFEYNLLSEGINDKGIFKAVFMCGSSGAGKSYVLTKIKSGSIEPRIVNTDKFIEFYGSEWTRWVVDKSKYLTKSQLVLYLNSMLPLAIDGTSANPNAIIRRQGILESIGYDTSMVFIKTPLETALRRVKERHQEMGRYVPDEFVKKSYESVTKLKGFYRGKFSPFIEIENDDGELTNEAVVNAFKKMTSFYSSKLKNPLGQDKIDKMKEEGEKYLMPSTMTKEEIQGLVSVWYRT